MIRTALRGLRGRLLLALVFTSAATLAVAAAVALGALQARLRSESSDALQLAAEDKRLGFNEALKKTAAFTGSEKAELEENYEMAALQRRGCDAC